MTGRGSDGDAPRALIILRQGCETSSGVLGPRVEDSEPAESLSAGSLPPQQRYPTPAGRHGRLRCWHHPDVELRWGTCATCTTDH